MSADAASVLNWPWKWVALVVLLLTGCATEPEEERRIGEIAGYHEDDPWVDMPDTVGVGSSFPIRLTAFGGGCDRKGETEVEWAGSTVTITPYKYVDLTQVVCDRILLYFRHRVTVMPERVHEPGELLVRFRGYEAPNYDDVIVVERTIHVRALVGG